jgi:hypothetical protein
MKWTWIPTKKIAFHIALPADEVRARIMASLDETAQKKAVHRFAGKIDEKSFEIWELVPPRSNSFTPVVKGTLTPDGTGTLIQTTMRMNGCAWIFVLVWCYPFALMLSLVLVNSFREGIHAFMDVSLLFILLFPAFMITITTLGFRSGVRAARALMVETFGPEMTEI